MDTGPASDAGGDDTKSSASSAKGPVRAYPPSVLDERQPRSVDLIPQRPYMLAMLALVGLTAIATVEAFYIHLYDSLAHGFVLPGLDLAHRGNLAEWLSSFLLGLGAVGSLVVYLIRVHRIDDYRGSYRVWLWTAAGLLLASIDVTTGLHHSLNALLASVCGVDPSGLGQFLWLGVFGLLYGGLGVRLACELWPSIEAFAGLAITTTLYVVAAMFAVGVIAFEGTLLNIVAATTVTMLAHGSLLFAITLFGRHVHLDAQGRLKVRVDGGARKKKAKEKAKSRTKLSVVGSDEAAGTKRKKPAADKSTSKSDDKADAKPAGASISAATLKSPLSVAGQDDDEDESSEGTKLSRAERRRLKKLGQTAEPHRRAA